MKICFLYCVYCFRIFSYFLFLFSFPKILSLNFCADSEHKRTTSKIINQKLWWELTVVQLGNSRFLTTKFVQFKAGNYTSSRAFFHKFLYTKVFRITFTDFYKLWNCKLWIPVLTFYSHWKRNFAQIWICATKKDQDICRWTLHLLCIWDDNNLSVCDTDKSTRTFSKNKWQWSLKSTRLMRVNAIQSVPTVVKSYHEYLRTSDNFR